MGEGRNKQKMKRSNNHIGKKTEKMRRINRQRENKVHKKSILQAP
jgi:hypothetical protein